ncbi:DUF3038 domain-containing protein [Thalassoporum mexicanum]|uniref:DUF3038 domain-containing protein n=1 Tax=Thalassoporum mexicanum TaxID=3457544 RepID=UPI0002DF42AD|nr:DUF3038 domain-containing protein [Pseudanabaena sp. PCC 7367]
MQRDISTTDHPQPDLPIPAHFSRGCPRSVRMDIDNLLIAVEAIDLRAVDRIMLSLPELGLDELIPTQVKLWRMRNTNPMRRHYQRTNLNWDELRALVLIACEVAKPLNTVLRQLIITSQHVAEEKIEALGLQQNQRYLDHYIKRFQALYKSRMRSPSILSDDELSELATHMLSQLLFCSGTAAPERLWHALFYGAIA